MACAKVLELVGQRVASEVECSVTGYQRLGARVPRACDMARPAARQRTEKALDGFLKC